MDNSKTAKKNAAEQNAQKQAGKAPETSRDHSEEEKVVRTDYPRDEATNRTFHDADGNNIADPEIPA